jgi:DNA-binding beta-propeller fold protein YncE
MRTSTGTQLALVLGGAWLVAAACTSSEHADSPTLDDVTPGSANAGIGGSSAGGNTPQGPGSAAGSASAPELEREPTFRAPVVTGKYVWSANPDSGRVAIIDADSYEIRAAQAGLRPTYVAAVSQEPPRALVINAGNDTASLLELSASAEVSNTAVALHQGADSWSVSPDGRFAIAWTDSRNATRPDPTDGFQDITVLELATGAAPMATRLTVGYRPSAFAFNAAGTRAFGITQDGISVIELAAGSARLSRLVSLPSTARVQPDVSVTPDGSRALARLEGSSILYDIDLVSGQLRELELGGVITDLDLSEDGGRAVAVLERTSSASGPDAGAPVVGDAGADAAVDAAVTSAPVESPSEAVFIAIPAGLTAAAERQTLAVPGESFRSVALSRDGARAVLFTTARPTPRVTLVAPDLGTRSLDLIAAVRAVFLTADGSHAIALQDPPAGSQKLGAFSVLSLANVRAPKLVASDAPAVAVALPPGSSERALVTVSDRARNSFGAFLVRTPNLQVDFTSLSSEPLASGTVPGAQKGFIAQVHPEGRITFIDLNDGAEREITGFELSSRVVSE